MKKISLKNKFISGKMMKTVVALTSGRVFNMVVSLVLLLIQSRFIGPDITGKVAFFAIPIGYLWILTLGIPSALARELPYFLARGEREKAIQYAETAQFFSVVIGALCSAVFAVLAIRSLIMGDLLFAMGWAFQCISAFFAIYSSFVSTLYRTTDEFIRIAKSSAISAMTNIIVFPLIFINPILGLFVKTTFSSVTTNIYLHIKRPLKLRFRFDVEIFKRLFVFGMPLIIIGYIEANLWKSVQSTIVVSMLGTTSLGLFNFINKILMMLLMIPYAVADILRPKFATVYGKTDGDLRESLKSAFKPLLLSFLFSLMAVGISMIFLGDIVTWLLPKYVDAIPALKIALFLVPVMSIAPIKYMFVVTKDYRNNALSTIPGFLFGNGLLYLILSKGVGFQYVFLPYILGQALNFIITVAILLSKTRNKE